MILVVLSGIQLITSPGVMNYVSAKYTTNTQTQANVNDCNTGTDCGITSPQIQGNGPANSPTKSNFKV